MNAKQRHTLMNQIETAINYAKGKGVLLVNNLGAVKMIDANSLAGSKRVIKIIETMPALVIGFYQKTKDISEYTLAEYMLEDIESAGVI